MIDCAFLTFDQTVKVEIIKCISEVNDFHKCLRLAQMYKFDCFTTGFN